MRRALVLLLLLGACATRPAPSAERWIEFHYAPGWVSNGAIGGSVSATGIVQARAVPKVSGKPFSFERQLRPEDFGRVRRAIEAHRQRFPPKAVIREGLYDAGDLSIEVVEAGAPVLSFRLAGPCRGGPEGEAYQLWNALMRSIRSPDYDTREHEFHCGKGDL